MFKAVKMKRLKFLLLSFVLGCAMLAGAHTPEVFPLWPQGVKENNGEIAELFKCRMNFIFVAQDNF